MSCCLYLKDTGHIFSLRSFSDKDYTSCDYQYQSRGSYQDHYSKGRCETTFAWSGICGRIGRRMTRRLTRRRVWSLTARRRTRRPRRLTLGWIHSIEGACRIGRQSTGRKWIHGIAGDSAVRYGSARGVHHLRARSATYQYPCGVGPV